MTLERPINRILAVMVLSCACSVLQRTAQAKKFHDPTTHFAFEVTDAWKVHLDDDAKTVVAVKAIQPASRSVVYVLHWHTTRPSDSDARQGNDTVLTAERIRDSASRITKSVMGSAPTWTSGGASFPGDLRFPTPMAVAAPLYAVETDAKAHTEAWLWQGTTTAYAVLAHTELPGSGRSETRAALSTFRLALPRTAFDRDRLTLMSFKKGRVFSIALPEGFAETVDRQHFCRGALVRMKCRHLTDGTTDLHVFKMWVRSDEDTETSTRVLDDEGFAAALAEELDVRSANGDSWSFLHRITQVTRYYSSGRIFPVYTADGGEELERLAVFRFGKTGGVALVATGPDKASLDQIWSRVERAGYDPPSRTLTFLYYLGAVCGWIGALLFWKINDATKLVIGSSVTLMLASTACLVTHLMTAPPLPYSIFSLTVLLYLPVGLAIAMLVDFSFTLMT